MAALWVIVAFFSACLYIYRTYRSLARNIAAVEKSGIPYVVLPVYNFSFTWLLIHRPFLPVLRWLPESWTSPWLKFLEPNWIWRLRFDIFNELGSDSFYLVAPTNRTLYVADAEAIAQITMRRADFPKPVELYKSVSIFGNNVVVSEGSEWRHHRKITSPSFTESNNHLVFAESASQTVSMLTKWDLNGGKVSDISADCMRLALYVISSAGFGTRLIWPHEESDAASAHDKIDFTGTKPAPGHSLSFVDALSGLLENLIWIVLFPKWVLARAPVKKMRAAEQFHVEWNSYMGEMLEKSKSNLRNGVKTEGLDLFEILYAVFRSLPLRGALVKGAGVSINKSDEEKGNQLLSDDEIISNAFVFLLAGHETTANTLHYALLLLALRPSSQKRLQKELDEILGDRPIDQWDYEQDFQRLFSGMPGAVLNEVLRLIPPVVGIPKSTTKDRPQPLNINGQQCVIPGSTYVTLVAAGVHRNPRYWPAWKDDDGKLHENDLEDFRPERWLPGAIQTTSQTHSEHGENLDGEGVGGPVGAYSTSALYHPARGAFIPFSEGYRSCLGRRFSQVEFCAILAVIFRTYTVELDVGEWATDEEVNSLAKGGEERQAIWAKAEERAYWLFKHGMRTLITIQMRGGKVPIRLVRRGSERFKY